MAALAPDFADPDWYDRQEAHGQARAQAGEPDVWDDEYWRGVDTPAPPARTKEKAA